MQIKDNKYESFLTFHCICPGLKEEICIDRSDMTAMSPEVCQEMTLPGPVTTFDSLDCAMLLLFLGICVGCFFAGFRLGGGTWRKPRSQTDHSPTQFPGQRAYDLLEECLEALQADHSSRPFPSSVFFAKHGAVWHMDRSCRSLKNASVDSRAAACQICSCFQGSRKESTFVCQRIKTFLADTHKLLNSH